MFIGHQSRARLHMLTNDLLDGSLRDVGDGTGTRFATAFKQTHDDHLARATLRSALAVAGVLILLFAANVSFVSLNLTVERAIEGLGAGRVTKPLGHKPRRLLRYANILGELSAGDTLLVT